MTKSKSEEILARTVKMGKQKSCKSTFFPFDPFSYKKKTQITPPPFFFSVLIKFDTAHIFIPPAIQREGGI
jgi:hypothetical protein